MNEQRLAAPLNALEISLHDIFHIAQPAARQHFSQLTILDCVETSEKQLSHFLIIISQPALRNCAVTQSRAAGRAARCGATFRAGRRIATED